MIIKAAAIIITVNRTNSFICGKFFGIYLSLYFMPAELNLANSKKIKLNSTTMIAGAAIDR